MSGSVFKRGDKYGYVIDLPMVDGKRQQRKRSGFRTKRAADDALTAAKVEVMQGYITQDSGQYLADFLEEWLDSVASSLRPNSITLYRCAVKNWINPRIGKIRLRDLTTPRLQSFYAELSRSGREDGTGGLSARSVRIAHGTLLRALQRAVDWHLIAVNPAAGNLSLPRQAQAEAKTWTPEEARTFLASVAGTPLAPLWTLMLATGLRRGEALGLRWENVVMSGTGGTVTVVQTVVSVAGRLHVSEPKTASSKRTIALHPNVAAALEKHFAATGSPDSGYVFRRTGDRPLDPGRTLTAFHEACKQAGVPQLRLHELRHTAATLALKAGVHPKLVMAMLGHSSIAITLDLYSHVQPGMAKEATDQIGGLLFDDPPSMN